MTTNLRALPKPDIEGKLITMKELHTQIKELTAHYDMLKQEVIVEYFSEEPEYRTAKGLLLASYKPQERNTFNQSKFKADHEDIFQLYAETKTLFTFLLK